MIGPGSDKNICRAIKVTKLGGRKELVIQFSIAANLAPRVKLEQESPRDHSKLLSPLLSLLFSSSNIFFTFCYAYMIMYRQKTTLSCFPLPLPSLFFFYIVSYTFCCSYISYLINIKVDKCQSKGICPNDYNIIYTYIIQQI